MRARFTAYVKNAPQYIVRPRPPAPTAAPASPPASCVLQAAGRSELPEPRAAAREAPGPQRRAPGAPRAAARRRLRRRRRRQGVWCRGARGFFSNPLCPRARHSTHPENPAARGTFNADGTLSSTLLEDAAATCRRFAYRRLSIVRAPPPEPDAADAWVTFQARAARPGRAGSARGAGS